MEIKRNVAFIVCGTHNQFVQGTDVEKTREIYIFCFVLKRRFERRLRNNVLRLYIELNMSLL